MSAAAEKKLITLTSSDGESFEVEEEVAMQSQTIKHMIEDDCADNGIPLPNVASNILAKVIEYCKKHHEPAKSDDAAAVDPDSLKNWDKEFVNVVQPILFDLILAANYLNIKELLDLGGGRHDQGQESGGDKEVFQHQERLYPRGRSRGP